MSVRVETWSVKLGVRNAGKIALIDEVNGVPISPVARNTADEVAIKLGDWTGCPRPQKTSEGGRENR